MSQGLSDFQLRFAIHGYKKDCLNFKLVPLLIIRQGSSVVSNSAVEPSRATPPWVVLVWPAGWAHVARRVACRGRPRGGAARRRQPRRRRFVADGDGDGDGWVPVLSLSGRRIGSGWAMRMRMRALQLAMVRYVG